MEYRQLGQTGLNVSVVALGCWALAGDNTWGHQEVSESIATVHAALDCGVTFFDTAEVYGDGRSEELLGQALEGRRQDAVIASKFHSGRTAPEDIAEACEASLKRLRTDVIDYYQVHWPNRSVPLADVIEATLRLKESGKIRALGVCNFSRADLEACGADAALHANQLPYSLLWRAVEFDLMAACRERNMGILPYSPLQQGLLTGKFACADEVPEGRARTRHFSGDRPQTRHGEAGCEAETFAAIAPHPRHQRGLRVPHGRCGPGLAPLATLRDIGAGRSAKPRPSASERPRGGLHTHRRHPARTDRGNRCRQEHPRPEPRHVATHRSVTVYLLNTQKRSHGGNRSAG